MMGSYQWVVRGVDQELAKRLVALAAQHRRTAGELLNEALKAYLDQSDDTAPTGTTGPLEARVMALEGRVAAMEAERHQRAADKPVEAVEPSPPRKRAKPTKLTPELEAKLTAQALKLRAEGLSQRAIGLRLGIAFGTVNKLLKAAAGSPIAPGSPLPD